MEKKVFKVLIMITVLVMAVTTAVQANSFTASMTPSKTTIKPGTEFQVTVKISNLDVGSNGINTLSGFLKYDAAVFEVINESNVEGVNDWKATFSSDNGNEYTLIVRGDTNCDGKITLTDLSKLVLEYNETKGFRLEGVQLDSGDVNCDGKISLTDLSQLLVIYTNMK